MTKVSSTVLRAVAHQRINKALNKVDTFVNHPSFDTKGSVIMQLRASREACEALYEALTDRFIMEDDSWECDWGRYQTLIAKLELLRGSDIDGWAAVKTALYEVRSANSELRRKADEEYLDCALCETREEHYSHTH